MSNNKMLVLSIKSPKIRTLAIAIKYRKFEEMKLLIKELNLSSLDLSNCLFYAISTLKKNRQIEQDIIKLIDYLIMLPEIDLSQKYQYHYSLLSTFLHFGLFDNIKTLLSLPKFLNTYSSHIISGIIIGKYLQIKPHIDYELEKKYIELIEFCIKNIKTDLSLIKVRDSRETRELRELVDAVVDSGASHILKLLIDSKRFKHPSFYKKYLFRQNVPEIMFSTISKMFHPSIITKRYCEDDVISYYKTRKILFSNQSDYLFALIVLYCDDYLKFKQNLINKIWFRVIMILKSLPQELQILFVRLYYDIKSTKYDVKQFELIVKEIFTFYSL